MPLLTPTQVTRKALAIFHQKATFLGSMNRAYDDSFAKTGAKIGDTLKIRLPNRYKSFTGLDQTANFQNTDETSVNLQVANIRSVPLKFTDIELTLSLDEFSARILEPAMAQLAADVENEVFQGLYWKVYQQVGTPGTIPNSLRVLNQARAKMTDSLAPGADRTTILNTDAQVEIVDAVKGLFQDQSKVAKQYREGIMGTTAGFGDIYESTLIPVHTNGTATGAITVTSAPAEGASVINLTGTGTQQLRRGTVFTIANGFMLHPETKVSTGKLQQFTVLADNTAVAGAYTAVSVSPAFIASATNPRQNISALPGATAVVTLAGAASTAYAQNLAFHKDAFTFATASLSVPKGAEFVAEETYDGITLRVWKDWDIKTGIQYTRCDILYGYEAIRPEAACRITA
jgi:P22 coat protein - gene protein 5